MSVSHRSSGLLIDSYLTLDFPVSHSDKWLSFMCWTFCMLCDEPLDLIQIFCFSWTSSDTISGRGTTLFLNLEVEDHVPYLVFTAGQETPHYHWEVKIQLPHEATTDSSTQALCYSWGAKVPSGFSFFSSAFKIFLDLFYV